MNNTEFDLAEQFALHTRKHCFVSGRAGTAKTTLLRKLVQGAQKNIVVVAPTGVAAVNAGGATIHSMFGLPLSCFVPADDPVDPAVATNRARLLGAHDVLPTTTIDAVIAFLRDHVDANLTAIRIGTGDRFDYNDIRMAVAHWVRTHASKQA